MTENHTHASAAGKTNMAQLAEIMQAAYTNLDELLKLNKEINLTPDDREKVALMIPEAGELYMQACENYRRALFGEKEGENG